MAQLSFEFDGESPSIAQGGAGERREDDLDRAYARASSWSRALAERLGQPIRLVVTDNKSTMLAARPRDGRLEVRLHHMFLTANENILDAVGDYLSDADVQAAAVIDRFVEDNRARFVAPGPSQAALRSEGRHHDLRAMADDLARRHFGGEVDVRITWGKRVQPKRRQRSLQLGTYLPEERLIRIHPVLDQLWVPGFFVESVVFHEMPASRYARGHTEWPPPLPHSGVSEAGAELRVPLHRAAMAKRQPFGASYGVSNTRLLKQWARRRKIRSSISIPITLGAITVLLSIALMIGWSLLLGQKITRSVDVAGDVWLLVLGALSFVLIIVVLVLFVVSLARGIIEVRRPRHLHRLGHPRAQESARVAATVSGDARSPRARGRRA